MLTELMFKYPQQQYDFESLDTTWRRGLSLLDGLANVKD